MPVKLIIPNDGLHHMKLRTKLIGWFLKSLQSEWAGITRTSLNCFILWTLFDLQFDTSIIYNMPAFHALSGGVWPAPPYEFYEVSPELYPWSLAWNFFVISSLASVVAIFDTWIFTRDVRGKWRMRFAVCMFATILSGWSILSLKAESGVIPGLENRIKEERYWWHRGADQDDYNSTQREYRLRYHRERVEYFEGKLREIRGKQRRDRK
jgi:hypothetical protein